MIEPLLRSVSKVSTQTKAIRKAATLLLVKPGRRLEVFMLQRPGRGTFPNLHVFPGGKVDGADEGLDHHCQGLDDDEASRALGLERGGLCYWVTAIRECFEECGVLLAYRDDASLFAPADANETARFDDYRNALADGDLHMQAMLEREGLHLATDRVRYFSHWITPPSAPARFDTRFFITEMPGRSTGCGPPPRDRVRILGDSIPSTRESRGRALADDPSDLDHPGNRRPLPGRRGIAASRSGASPHPRHRRQPGGTGHAATRIPGQVQPLTVEGVPAADGGYRCVLAFKD